MQQSSLLAVRYRWGSRHLVGSAGMLLWEYQAMVDPYSGLKCAWVDCGDEGVVAMGLGWFVLSVQLVVLNRILLKTCAGSEQV